MYLPSLPSRVAETTMSQFTWSAASLYDQVLQELGGGQVSASKQTAIKNRMQEGLIDIWHANNWTWRKKRMTVTVAASTPFHELPDDYDSMSLTEIYSIDSDNADHALVLVSDADFERAAYVPDTNEPYCFRITQRIADPTSSSVYVPVLEVGPEPDQTYTYSPVEYYCSAPKVSWTAATAVAMPTEFHDVWHERALSDAAIVLGQEQRSQFHRAEYERKLQMAIARRDTQFPKGPARGVNDPYGDVSNLR